MSRKLATVIVQTIGIAGVILGCAVIGDVEKEIQMMALGLIGAGGGLNVLRQASIDKAKVTKDIEVEHLEGLTEKVLGQVENLKAKLPEVL